jgi:hypothetical protein
VDDVTAEADLRAKAIEHVGALAGKDRGTLSAIKTTMFAPAVSALSSGTLGVQRASAAL